MKKTILLFLSLVLTLSYAAAEKTPVFLYAGQSNADGREYTNNLPDYMKIGGFPSTPYAHLKYSNVQGNATPSFGPRTFVGNTANKTERYAFCDVTNYWIDQAMSSDFYAIKCAYGGTAIAPGVTAEKLPIWYADAEWMKSHYAYKGDDITNPAYANYNSLTKNLTEGFAYLVDKTLAAIDAGYDVKAIMWHQGESDRNAAADYYVNFKTMIAFMRNAIYEKTGDEADKNLPFIFGTVCRRSTQYSAGVEAAQKQVAEEDANVYYIDMKDATLLGDNLHFDRQATEYLGKKMYNKLVELGLVNGPQVEVQEFPKKESVMDKVDVPAPNAKWDFTTISQATKDALATEVNLESGALWNWHKSYGYRRANGVTEEELHTSGGYVIPETKGLYFTGATGNRICINEGGYMYFVDGSPNIFIPKLVAGQKIKVTAQQSKNEGTITPGLDMSDLLEVVGNNKVTTTKTTVTLRVRHNVTTPTHVAFCPSAYMKILKIELETPETTTLLIGADKVETFACDHPVDFSPFKDLFQAYVVTGYDNTNGVISIKPVDKIPANTGVVIIGEESQVNVSFLSIAPAAPAVNLLTPVVGEGTAPAGSFVITTNQGVTQFSKTTTSTNLRNQAYLALDGPTLDTYGFTTNEIPTSIKNMGDNQSAALKQNSIVYNLIGQRTNNNSKGIFIANGKKFAVR